MTKKMDIVGAALAAIIAAKAAPTIKLFYVHWLPTLLNFMIYEQSPHSKNLRKGRYSQHNQTYLITTVTYQRQRVFADFYLGRIVVQALRHQHQQGNVHSLAFVLMPDHLHWLFILQNNNTLAKVMQHVKGSSAYQIQKIRQERAGMPLNQALWQDGYHDHALRKEEDLQQIARYIVANPLRAKLVNKIGDYPLWDAVVIDCGWVLWEWLRLKRLLLVATTTTNQTQNLDVLKSRLKPLPQNRCNLKNMDKLKLHSPDFTLESIAKLAELFPNCVTETREADGSLKQAIDFDQLRQELSTSIVEGPQERYQLNWPGKREALLTANAPIAKTLRPVRFESVDFDSTQNLFIEGDNLDALKLLQETYLGKVKMIYIDPPYNTGKEFIYDDDFSEDTASYFQRSNQKDAAGQRMVANTETNGRFHSDWLSMMYPRLKLARNLLRDDGVIFISIDDNEQANLKRLCDEVFGEANFIASMVWEKGRKNDAKLVSVGHEYVLIFAKSLDELRNRNVIWREEKPGAKEIWGEYLSLRNLHGSNDSLIEADIQAWFSALPKNHPSKKWSRYKRIDENGPWRDRDISWPGGGGPRYDVLHPKTGLPCKVPERGWIYASYEEMKRQIKLGLVEFRDDHTQPPFRKAHIRPIPAEVAAEVDIDETEESDDEQLATQVRGTYFYKQSQVAVKFLRGLLGAKAFNNPKDHFELAKLIGYVTADDSNAVVLDFFAGSASTAHAVFEANLLDGGRRRYVLVQIPEEVDFEKKDQKIAAKFCDDIDKPRNIAEIGKERIRRAGQKIRQVGEALASTVEAKASPTLSPPLTIDIGFRVLKIDSSNMKDVYYTPDAVQQSDLVDHVDNIREDRTAEDLLFQVLLDWGVDLTLPIVQESIAGFTVLFVDGNALAACFDTGINEAFVKELAARHPLRVVFRDAGFAGDSVKINIEQIFKLLSPNTEIKTI